MAFDLHIHSKYSHDSILEPEKIIKTAKKRRLSGIAVTDHNTIMGGVAAYKANKDKDFQVIIGAEIKTEYGDIIGINLNEEIKSRNFFGVIEEIQNQGGSSVIAHPFRQYFNPEKIVHNVDFVEIFNARSTHNDNLKASNLAKKFNKKVTAGSDAHCSFEIGRGKITFNYTSNENFLNNLEITDMGQESNYYFVHFLSLLIEKIKGDTT